VIKYDCRQEAISVNGGTPDVADIELEERVTKIEREIAILKTRVTQDSAVPLPWWEQVAGTFKDDAAHDEAMRLGRAYRREAQQETPEEK
jgi:hypothetical protein